MKRIISFILVFVTTLFWPVAALAAPYYYFVGTSEAGTGVTYTLDVYLVSLGSTVTAGQTVVQFDNTYLTAKSISILSSACTFWAPADPSLGYGNTPTPYFYPSSSSNKVVFSCGFSNPGYTSDDSTGDKIASIRFTPSTQGDTTLSFISANTLFRYIGSSVTPGTLSDFDLTVVEATVAPTPTSSPTPTPSASSSSSSSSDDSGTSNVTTITDEDLNFVEIGITNSSTGTNDEGVTLEVVEEDNAIPNAPVLEPRPAATPFVFSLLNGGSGDSGSSGDSGEVLAAQSLRELLIPGKSQADKTVVLINLISTITFLVLLAIVIWRLVTITRVNRLKSKHMKDVLASELAVFESKLGNANSEFTDQIREEIDQAVKKLNQ